VVLVGVIDEPGVFEKDSMGGGIDGDAIEGESGVFPLKAVTVLFESANVGLDDLLYFLLGEVGMVEPALHEFFAEGVVVGSVEDQEEGLFLVAVVFAVGVVVVAQLADGLAVVAGVLLDDVRDVFGLFLGGSGYFAEGAEFVGRPVQQVCLRVYLILLAEGFRNIGLLYAHTVTH
jgi:hypothetical protein